MCSKPGDSLLTIKRALEAKELARQQLRDQLDEVEKETRSKLQEIDIFNNQLKVTQDSLSLSECSVDYFLTWLWGKKKWTEMIEDVSSGSILKSVCWGFYLVFILFLRKCCSAFKLRVWINLFCRISVGGNLSPDSGSMTANMKLPISVLLHARSAGQGQQICWNQDFKLRSWIKETWFSAATLNFYVLSVCSFLSLSVAVCGLWFHALLLSLC